MDYEFPISMRICYVGGANNIHLLRWIKWIANAGHDVHLITDHPTEINNVKIYSLKHKKDGGYINFISKMRQTKKLVNKINPDILHAHYVFGYGTFAAYTNFHPFVLSAWGSDILIDPKKSKVIKFLVKYSLDKADLITADGENTIDEIKKFNVDPQKIHCIYHGVDPFQFSPSRIDEKLQKKYEISDSPIIISIRNLKTIYDIDTLIQSVPLVLKDFPKAKFIIAGDAGDVSNVNKNYKDHLKDLSKSLGVFDNIRFVGKIPHDQLPYYLTASNVYVSTSVSDGGIAISTLEAMACGLAPIVTDVGDNKKWIKDGENGFIIPIKDPKILAEKIIYLLGNENLRKQFGKINRKIVEEKQNYEKEMEKMEMLYNDVICK